MGSHERIWRGAQRFLVRERNNTVSKRKPKRGGLIEVTGAAIDANSGNTRASTGMVAPYSQAARQDNNSGQSNGRQRSSSGLSRTNSYARLANQPLFPVEKVDLTEHSRKTVMTSAGIQYSSWYARDPFRLSKIEAVILPYVKVNWDTFQTPAPAVVDSVAPVLGARVKAMFEQLVNVININGRFTPNQLLTAVGDFTAYLDFYTNAFTEIWAAMCVIKAMDLNSSFRAFGAGVAGGGNLDRIATAWRRLQLVPIPPEIPKMLSKMMGVLYSEPEDFAYVAYSDPNATSALVTDWTLATGAGSVAALLTTAEGQLAALETSGAEVSIIQELMSIVYGDPTPLPEPFVNSNQVAFDMHFTREAVFFVVTFFAQPTIVIAGGPGGTFPVLIRKGYEKDEMSDLMFTFLRPQMYDAAGLNGTLGATHSSVGLFTQSDNQSGFSRVYGPLPGNNTIFQDTSFAALNFGNNTFVEIEFWAEFVQSNSGTVSWANDSRSYDPWTSFYPNPASIGSNTEAWINRLFFTGMKIKELR